MIYNTRVKVVTVRKDSKNEFQQNYSAQIRAREVTPLIC